MLELSGFDLKRARLVPHAVFDNPGDVVTASFLSFAQKQAILRRWEFDARRMQGGTEGDAPPMLGAVQQALRAVAAERAREGRGGAGEGFEAAAFDPGSIGEAWPRG
jgi:hypothetical protein